MHLVTGFYTYPEHTSTRVPGRAPLADGMILIDGNESEKSQERRKEK